MPPLPWLTGRWYDLASPIAVHILLVFASIVAGALVGFERERADKPAGLRTLALVSLGATLFTMLSPLLGGEEHPGYVAAQVVAGVGFLGAGAILRTAGTVSGVTSAASVWFVAAIGMVIGAGFGAAGIALAVLAVLILTGVARLERWYMGPCRLRRADVAYLDAGGKGTIRVAAVLDDARILPAARTFMPATNGIARVHFRYCEAHRHHRDILSRLAALDDVTQLETDRD